MKHYRSIKFFSSFLIISLLVTIFSIGCTTYRKPIPQTTKKPIAGTNKNYATNTKTGVNYNAEKDIKIANQLVTIKGVRSATVLTNTNTVYVGLDLDKNAEASRTKKIEDEAIAKVKSMDPSATKVYVSANVDVATRLRNYVQDVKTGKPISGFTTQIEEMFMRVVPRT